MRLCADSLRLPGCVLLSRYTPPLCFPKDSILISTRLLDANLCAYSQLLATSFTPLLRPTVSVCRRHPQHDLSSPDHEPTCGRPRTSSFLQPFLRSSSLIYTSVPVSDMVC